MCYGMGCKFESHMGECRKPASFINEAGEREKLVCPESLCYCENCGESFQFEDRLSEARVKGTRTNLFICEECMEDIETFLRVL